MTESLMHKQLKHIYLSFVVLFATIGLTGCASTRQNAPRVMEETAPPNKALIIVERTSSVMGGAIAIKVSDNGTGVGKLGPGGKLSWLREPGLMDLFFNDFGKSLCVDSGGVYRYTVGLGKGNNLLSSPGIGITRETARHSPEDSLVFFRFRTSYTQNKAVILKSLKIVNIKTGKLTDMAVDVLGNARDWNAAYLPVGEYFIPGFEVDALEMNGQSWSNYRIRAEFAVTKPNVGVYVGDITLDGGRVTVGRDSSAAHQFLEKNMKPLSYCESLITVNQ